MDSLKRRRFLHSSLFATGFWLSRYWHSNSNSSARAQNLNNLPPPPTTRELVANNTAFALDLYRYLASEPGNLFFSPYSISAALAMTYAGARARTAAEMATVLHFSQSPERLHAAFADLRAGLEVEATEEYQLAIANRLWGQRDYPFRTDFLQLIEDRYGATLGIVDFERETETARQTINTWVDQHTNGKIPELLPPNILSTLTRFVLTNAVYFKAAWIEPFSSEQTEEELFSLASGEKVSTLMMKGETGVSKFIALDEVKLLQLFYQPGTESQSMIVILPNQVDGLPRLEQQLTSTLLAEWIELLNSSEFIVDKDDLFRDGNAPVIWLPKFKLSAKFNLKQALKDLGMPSAFNASADFSDVASLEKLYLQAVIHKTFIDVNEAGTEAAAATAVAVGARGSSHRLQIRVDRPFLFLIQDVKSKTVLFLGRVENPVAVAE